MYLILQVIREASVCAFSVDLKIIIVNPVELQKSLYIVQTWSLAGQIKIHTKCWITFVFKVKEDYKNFNGLYFKYLINDEDEFYTIEQEVIEIKENKFKV